MRSHRPLGTGLAALALGLGPVIAPGPATASSASGAPVPGDDGGQCGGQCGALPAGLALSTAGVPPGSARANHNQRYAEWAWHHPDDNG